jgi:hypothetical protein
MLPRPLAATPLPTAAARRPRRRGVIRRAASFAVQLAAVGVIAAEGGAWVSAERFRDAIPAIDGATLADRRHEYEAIRDWGPFDMGIRARVDQPLKRRLVAMADAVIADYRRDGPTMSAADWQQAHDAVLWARDISPRDSRLQARQAICEAHLARLGARVHRRGSPASREAYTEAITRFEAAAKLDDTSFDPYLGISNIKAYALDDIETAAEAIAEAEKRGYQPGRRERAQLGDGYLRRADRTRRRAAGLSGESRRAELQKARDDYARCIERFTPIPDFGRSGANLEYCRERMEEVGAEIEAQTMPSWLAWFM